MRFTRFDPRYSLRVRIALIVASLTLVLALLLTIVIGQISGRQLEQTIGQTLTQLSSNVISAIDRTMFERWREIRIMSSQSAFLASSGDTSSLRALLDQLKETYRYYAWIGWVNADGTVTASSGGLLEGQNVATRPWFTQAKNAQTPYIGDMHEPVMLTPSMQSDGMPDRFVDIAEPARAPDGTLIGVLGASLDWRFIREQSGGLEQQFARPGDPSRIDVLILDPDGTVLVGPPQFSAPTMSTLPVLTLPSVKAAQTGKAGYLTETWSDDNLYLTGYAKDAGYRGYPGLGWIVLIRQRADVALASVSQLQAIILAIGVVSALVFSVLGWFLVGHITRPLAKVAAIASAIKTGDEPRIHAKTPGDEVTVLSRTIDKLLVSLNTRNTQLTTLNNNLEQRIQERTAELATSQRFNEKVMNTAPDMVYTVNLLEDRINYVNTSATALIGYAPAEMMQPTSQFWATLIHPDDVCLFQAHRKRVIEAADGVLCEQTYRIKHKAGHWIWMECRETVFSRGGDGQVTALLGIAQDVTLRKQAEDRLQETAAAQERQRLARELHDSVSQTLFSATMVAQTLPLLWEKGEATIKKNLDELLRLTRGALAEMRTLLNELRPKAIETAEMSELLSQLLDAARGRTQAQCQLTLDGEGSMPPEVQVAAYRVAQEALNNAAKHARAAHINVELHQQADQVTMRIGDDGRGFDQNHALSNHFGIGIMHERAQEIGAQVDIHSTPGQGTEVTFCWQIAHTPQP